MVCRKAKATESGPSDHLVAEQTCGRRHMTPNRAFNRTRRYRPSIWKMDDVGAPVNLVSLGLAVYHPRDLRSVPD
jgi:hypothetical protein